jgi:hypothetical protein
MIKGGHKDVGFDKKGKRMRLGRFRARLTYVSYMDLVGPTQASCQRLDILLQTAVIFSAKD